MEEGRKEGKFINILKKRKKLDVQEDDKAIVS